MPKSANALELLRKDHRTVLALVRRFEKCTDGREQRVLCDEIVSGLDAHARLEEDCFYPYVRESTDRLDLIEEATIEHDTAKRLMHELDGGSNDPARFHALVKVLGEYFAMHAREEEERIFPLVEKLGIDLEALGAELAERRERGNGTRPPANAGRRAASRSGREGKRNAAGERGSRGDTKAGAVAHRDEGVRRPATVRRTTRSSSPSMATSCRAARGMRSGFIPPATTRTMPGRRSRRAIPT